MIALEPAIRFNGGGKAHLFACKSCYTACFWDGQHPFGFRGGTWSALSYMSVSLYKRNAISHQERLCNKATPHLTSWAEDACMSAGHVNHSIFWTNLTPPKVSAYALSPSVPFRAPSRSQRIRSSLVFEDLHGLPPVK